MPWNGWASSCREVRELIAAGRVTVEGGVEKRPERKVSGQETIAVDGLPVTVQKTLTLMLHKPRGYVSAARDARDKTVLELVPPQYRRKGLFPAGRLDKDTTGLMILTDDGALAHEILAPKRHVPKRYRVTVDLPLTEEMVTRFAEGIALKDGMCRPARLEILSEHTGIVTLQEGRYHQIKRMFGVYDVGVNGLHRTAIGGLALDAALAPGQWRALTAEEVHKIQQR